MYWKILISFKKVPCFVLTIAKIVKGDWSEKKKAIVSELHSALTDYSTTTFMLFMHMKIAKAFSVYSEYSMLLVKRDDLYYSKPLLKYYNNTTFVKQLSRL